MRSRKGLWLLALLTLRHNRPVERELLARTLWPDVDQSTALTNLRPILTELRNALGDQRYRLQTPDRDILMLDLTGADVDILIFDAATSGGKPADLQQAVTLYRGSLLEGCTEEWVFQERNVREQRCLQALQQLGDNALAAGDAMRAAGYYQRAVGLDPWSDAARRGWMKALADNGDHNAALQVYREFVEQLRDAPNIAPDEQTTALYMRLRAETRRQPDVHAVVSGEYRELPKVAGYLPHALSGLVGREDERSEVALCLRRARLVTLTGLGGIGKTRLALEVAREVLREYADGVWLIALDMLTDKRMLVNHIASVLEVKDEAARPLLESLTERIRQKRLLLVLDNCEHLREASAELVAHLLRECMGVRILATSREPLGVPIETVWMVPPLAVPDPEHLPKGQATTLRVLMGYESVQLFVERAHAVHQTFLLTGSNARSVAQVCYRLEGIPLAIELAAARVKVLPVDEIAARLNNALPLLAGGSRTVQSRQQTLRATLDWSYALLSEPERVLLCRLSVFVGGWTLEAAEQVCSGNGIEAYQVASLLTTLAEKSLIAIDERAEDIGRRYRLLEIVRQYAGEALEATGELNEVRVRHRNWLAALAEETDRQLTNAVQGQWLERLETEHNNVRATLSWNVTEPEGEETGLRLTGALWQYWDIRGYYSEGRRHLRQALAQQQTSQETAARARALTGAAALAYRQGDYAAARELHQQSLNIFRKLGNRSAVAASLANQGTAAYSQGDYGAARTLLEESLNIHRELENRSGIASTLQSLGQLFLAQTDYASAWTCFEESLSLRRQLGDLRGIAYSLDDFGNLAVFRGDYAAARTLLEESLSLRRQIGDRDGMALSLGTLAEVAIDQDDPAAARLYLDECLIHFQEMGDRQKIAVSFVYLGTLANDEGDYALARKRIEDGLALFRQSGHRHGIAFALIHLGDVVTAQGDYAAARALLEESVAIYRTMGNTLGVVDGIERMAAVFQAAAEDERAVRLWSAAQVLRENIGARRSPREQKRYDDQVRRANTALSVEAFAGAWEAGAAMTMEQAIDLTVTAGRLGS
jgi:predicted ATPase/DNA-binding SARP family transcriptional activator